MRRMLPLVLCLCLTLCLAPTASAGPAQTGKSDCKSLISHSGFAEFVIASEGGTQKLAIKVSPSVEWSIRNSDYIEWIEIQEGASGTGPGTLTLRLEPNTGKFCRVGVLTISGLAPVYGSPIRILQRGVPAAGEPAEADESSQPWLVNIAPFSENNPLNPGTPQYKKSTRKR